MHRVGPHVPVLYCRDESIKRFTSALSLPEAININKPDANKPYVLSFRHKFEEDRPTTNPERIIQHTSLVSFACFLLVVEFSCVGNH